jgi:hypothetical protein
MNWVLYLIRTIVHGQNRRTKFSAEKELTDSIFTCTGQFFDFHGQKFASNFNLFVIHQSYTTELNLAIRIIQYFIRLKLSG